MDKAFTKETVLKLLGGMSSEKEIRKYLERFSSDDYRFAVIKVGGAIIRDDLESLVSSLLFLNEVGLRPIIVHGAGPMLSKKLEESKVKFSFKNGQRITTDEVLKIAIRVFDETNNQLCKSLEANGVNATPINQGIFTCKIKDKDLGHVGEIVETNSEELKNILATQSIPVISPLGATEEGEFVNINADNATIAIAKEISPDKIIFLSESGGILDEQDQLISTINIKDDYDKLMTKDWLHSGMKLKLEQIKLLLNILPTSSSISITKPINLNRELFTDAGFGTLIKSGHEINKKNILDHEEQRSLQLVLEKSFNGKLVNNYFDNEIKEYYLSSCKRAAIVMTFEDSIPYMDKFAVIDKARGEGLGNAIWKRMLVDHSKVFWRSRPNNSINKFYMQVCDGFQRYEDWNIFWIGISDLKELTKCIESASSKPATINYEK